jgi:glycolate oxidase FAD binding subunit
MTIFPTTEAELSEAITSTTTPLVISGGGTRRVRTADGAHLSTARLSGIVDYEPGALTMVAKAGTPLSDIQAALAAEHQQLAFEPSLMGSVLGQDGQSTIGGVFATNASGPRRIQAGAARDFLLGVRFVDGAGNVVKNGGRVMKNVTGYDLVKLLAGSWGTLGVMSEVSFKVLPLAETMATIAVHVSDAATATAAMTASLNTPFDVTGAAYDPASGRAVVRVEGFEKSVAYRAAALRDVLAQFGAVEILDNAASAPIWTGLQNLDALVGTTGDLWRVSVKPTDGAEVIARVCPTAYVMDWSGGLIWMRTAAGQDVRTALTGIDGHATCHIGRAPQFHPNAAGVEMLMSAIRSKFDPHAKLNQGLMG